MKTITIDIYNTFARQTIMKITMPWVPEKAATGYYSKMARSSRQVQACGVEKSLVKTKVTFENRESDRMILSLPSGFGMSLPFNLTTTDCQIIILHLEAFKLAAKR